MDEKTTSVQCGSFKLDEFLKPIEPLNEEDKKRITDMIKVSEERALTMEIPAISRLKERIVKSIYTGLSPEFLKTTNTFILGDKEYGFPRFMPFRLYGRTNTILLGTDTFQKGLYSYAQLILKYQSGMEGYEMPLILKKHLLQAIEFYDEKNFLKDPNNDVYRSQKKISRDYRKKFTDNNSSKSFLFTLETLIPPASKKKAEDAEDYFGKNVFAIVDYKHNPYSLNLVLPKNLLITGLFNDTLYLIDNPSMQEYQELKI